MPCPPRKTLLELCTPVNNFLDVYSLTSRGWESTSVGNGVRRRGSFPENRTLLVRPGPSLLLPREVGVEVVLITPMLRPPPPPTSSDLCFPSSALHPPLSCNLFNPAPTAFHLPFCSSFASSCMYPFCFLIPAKRHLSRDLSTGRYERFTAKFYNWSEQSVRVVSTNLWRLILLLVSLFLSLFFINVTGHLLKVLSLGRFRWY